MRDVYEKDLFSNIKVRLEERFPALALAMMQTPGILYESGLMYMETDRIEKSKVSGKNQTLDRRRKKKGSEEVVMEVCDGTGCCLILKSTVSQVHMLKDTPLVCASLSQGLHGQIWEMA